MKILNKILNNYSLLPLRVGKRFLYTRKYNSVYSELKYFLENNPINEETQIKIEKFLLDNAVVESELDARDVGGLFKGAYSKKTTEFLLKFKPELVNKINNFMKFKEQYNDDSTLKSRSKQYLVDIIETVKKPFILTILLGRFIKILSNSRYDYSCDKNLVLDIALDLSKDLIRKYLSIKYQNDLKQKIEKELFTEDYTFSD